MKRVRNLVIGGIQNKVFNLILITVVLLTSAFIGVSLYHSAMLSDLAAESSSRQQDSIQEITDQVMDKVIDQSLTRSTQLEAYIADDMFHDLEHRVKILGEYAGKLFSDPEAYPREAFSAPDPAHDSETATQLILADGVDEKNPELADRIGLAANMSDLMASLFNASSEANSCFISLPEGVTLLTDDRSGAKIDESGLPVRADPRTRPWYKQAVKARGLIFTDVETDAFTGDIGIVCAMPVYVNNRLVAVVGADLFLNSMRDAVQESDENGSYVFVVNQNGHIVFSPEKEGILQIQTGEEAVDLRKSENAELADMIKDSMREFTEIREISLDDGVYYMTGAPMQTLGWAVISVCSKEAAGLPSAMLRDSYEQIQEKAIANYRDKTRYSTATALVLLLVVTALMLAASLLLAKKIVDPLNFIMKRISGLGGENLEFRMEDIYRTGDEIEELAESFAALSHKTLEYVDEVKRVTAEKERIGTELSLATEIQAAMLPHIFPAFPDRLEFDIFASMDPAKEVGGDFYDYFLIDDDHLGMLIADVSGKGVPAALFMMASKIIIQSCAKLGISAAEILEKTNEAICSNNEAEMFVTVWLGILEISTGKMTAANAGHEYPILKEPGEDFMLYKDKHGFVIGGLEGARYKEYELLFKPGAKIFVYTDGVPEATNAENELFGTERLINVLNEMPDAAPADILNNVRSAVDDFVKDAEQFDDLTMLCFEYKGSEKDD